MTFTWSLGRFPINVKLACGRSVGRGSSRSAAVADIMTNPVLSPAAFMRYVLVSFFTIELKIQFLK